MNWYGLIGGVGNDNTEEFEKWLKKFEPKFSDIAERYSIPESQLDDCFQLMRLVVWKSVSEARYGNKGKFVYVCLCHLAYDFARELKREKGREEKRITAEMERRAMYDRFVDYNEDNDHYDGLKRVAEIYFENSIGEEFDELMRVRLENLKEEKEEVRGKLIERTGSYICSSTYDTRWRMVKQRVRAWKELYYS